jgi:hypothetical protein
MTIYTVYFTHSRSFLVLDARYILKNLYEYVASVFFVELFHHVKKKNFGSQLFFILP